MGDDDPNPYYHEMKQAIRSLSDQDIPVYFMHGNRDFMIGANFAEDAGVTILDDPTPIELHGQSVLLSHGDALCTDDLEYQQLRTMVRNPEWQAMMMAKSLEERIAFAKQARQQSLSRSKTSPKTSWT